MKQRLGTSDDSSPCEHISGHPDLPSGDFNGRKRKCLSKDVASVFAPPSIGRDIKSGKTNRERAKYYKVVEGTEKDDSKGKVEESNSAHAEESGPEHIKDNAKSSLVSVKQDYIHVRARRGQATDSHSLAERVRREKISERMKFLQGLVPGCSKITGKAVMLDEIINYVQSLQRQVEFLSMKLAAVNPRLDLNLEGGNLAQDMFQPHCSFGSKPFAPDDTVAYPQLQKSHMQVGFGPHAGRHAVGNQAEVAAGRMRTPLPSTNGCEDPELQISNVWDDELQSAFPMGLEKNRNTHFTSQGVHGSLTTDHMKVAL